jgi:predicted nucleotidyltransferase
MNGGVSVSRSGEWNSADDVSDIPLANHMRLPDATQRLIRRIIAGYRPQRVIVHGSFARGDAHEGSDLDLIIVKRTSERFVDRIEQVLAFSDGEMALEPMVYTEQEIANMLSEGNSFLGTALAEGVIVYERQPPGGDALAVPGQV